MHCYSEYEASICSVVILSILTHLHNVPPDLYKLFSDMANFFFFLKKEREIINIRIREKSLYILTIKVVSHKHEKNYIYKGCFFI